MDGEYKYFPVSAIQDSHARAIYSCDINSDNDILATVKIKKINLNLTIHNIYLNEIIICR